MDKSEYEKMNVKKLVETICFLKEQNQSNIAYQAAGDLRCACAELCISLRLPGIGIV